MEKENLKKIIDEGFTETEMEFGFTSKIYEIKGTNKRVIYDEKTDDIFRYKYVLGEAKQEELNYFERRDREGIR